MNDVKRYYANSIFFANAKKSKIKIKTTNVEKKINDTFNDKKAKISFEKVSDTGYSNVQTADLLI